ncbi:MAG: TonB family protein [Pseudomonadota bacterium]
MQFQRFWAAYLVGLVFLVAPLNAQDKIEPSSDWRLREYEDKCRLIRNFGEGDQAVTLWLDQGGAQKAYNLTLIGKPFAYPFGRAIRIKPGDEEEILRSFITSKSSKGRPVIKLFGLTLVQPQLERALELDRPVAELTAERASAIDSLSISGAGLKPIRLNLGAMGAQFGFLQECGERIQALLSEAGRTLTGEARPPEAIRPDRWLFTKDWPSYLRAARMEGKISVRLTVGKNGRATDCAVIDSNKPQLFDDPVCFNLLRRARFKPALNGSGEPVVSYFFHKAVFYIK